MPNFSVYSSDVFTFYEVNFENEKNARNIHISSEVSQTTGCPRMFYTQKCKISRIFITIYTIEFGILIYFSDRAVCCFLENFESRKSTE